jgi:hypothetical protein
MVENSEDLEDHLTPEIAALAAARMNTAMRKDLETEGVNHELLAKQLRAELRAKESKFFKLKKGILTTDDPLPRFPPWEHLVNPNVSVKKRKDFKIVHETDDEILLSVNVRAWGVQQEARKDAHRLLNHYPALKQETDHWFPNGVPIKLHEMPAEMKTALGIAAHEYAKACFGTAAVVGCLEPQKPKE